MTKSIDPSKQKFKYFRKAGDPQPVDLELEDSLRKKNDFPYVKLTRCLLASLACTKFNSELNKARTFGTSSNQYKVPLRGKLNVKSKLMFVDDTVSSETIIKNAPWVINPLSGKYVAWQFLMSLLILYAMTFMPYGLVFMGDDTTKDLAETIMNMLFIVDIVVNFFTAIIDEDDK